MDDDEASLFERVTYPAKNNNHKGMRSVGVNLAVSTPLSSATSSSSSSSVFKIGCKDKKDNHHANDSSSPQLLKDEHLFLVGGDDASPSIYLLENSETVSNRDLEDDNDDDDDDTTTTTSSCRSILLDDDVDDNDVDMDADSENEDSDSDDDRNGHDDDDDDDDGDEDDYEDTAATEIDTASHFRKLFEKNVVRVKRNRECYFLSLPDLRPIRWLSAHDYFYYSIQDLTGTDDGDNDDDDDDDDDDGMLVVEAPDTAGASTSRHLMQSSSHFSLKDDNVLVGDQQPIERRHSSSEDERDDEKKQQQQQQQQKEQEEQEDDNDFHDNGSEEITWTRDGEHNIRTVTRLQRNPKHRSWEKTTEVTTFFPDGLSNTETYYETLYDDDQDDDDDDDDNGREINDNDDNLVKERTDEEDMNSLDHDSVRRRYEKSYQLRGNQFDLLKKCFKKMETNGFISRDLLKTHIQVQVKERSRLIRADEETIERTINTIQPATDAKSTDEITFQKFLDFLYLFFASKKNLRAKIVNVLSGSKRLHLARGSLTEREAKKFFDFLARFYGLKDEDRNRAAKFDDLQSYAEFADKVAPAIEDRLFVTWL